MDHALTVIKWLAVVVVGFWGALPELTQLLVALMVVDTLLGIIVAIKQHNLSPTAAWNGMTKKLVALLLVGVAALLNPHVQAIVEINLVQAASAFYVVPELTSIARNAAILEVPVFTQLQPILRYFQNASGDRDKQNDKP